MQTKFIVTLTGVNEPGLVSRLSELARTHEANWEESRFAQVAGRFAGIVQLRVPQVHAPKLQQSLESMTSERLQLTVETFDVAGAQESHANYFELDMAGADRPGLVHEISMLLSHNHVDILELNTERTDAPHAGGTVFHASALLKVPASLSRQRLRDQLEELASDMMVDVSLSEG